jgi:hypothetical protein
LKVYSKKIIGWGTSLLKFKKLTDEARTTALILYGGRVAVKQLMADLLKVETIVHFYPLVSLRKLFSFIYVANLGDVKPYTPRQYCPFTTF